MRKYRRLSILFAALAVLLSDVMCAVIGHDYAAMVCGILHQGFSAPASVVFWLAVPYGAGIAACAGLAAWFYRKSK